jgi:hypothetical protein
LNEEDINNLNRSIMSNDIKMLIKNLPAKKGPRPDGFSNDSSRPLKKNTNGPQTIP